MPSKDSKKVAEAAGKLRKKLKGLAEDVDPAKRRAIRKKVKRAQRKVRRLTKAEAPKPAKG
jgi:hypothetical protein